MGINFSRVSFCYDRSSKLHELTNINLTISGQNEFIMLLGHTGSGKSTLVQLMNALLLPHHGEITIFSKKITAKYKGKLMDIRQKVGLVFQFPEYQLFEETVLKDIMFGPKNFGQSKKEAHKSAINVCELIGIKEDLYERPPFNLSGGQMRKVAIAGILASKPQILILDEPTVGLDPKTKEELLKLLKRIQKIEGKTIVMITHDMDVVAKYADRVIVLENQTIAYDGDKHTLFNNLALLEQLNLSLPEVGKMALALKEKKLIEFDQIPITQDELIQLLAREVPCE